MELTPKSSLIRILPFPVHYLKGYVFVRRTSVKSQNGKLLVLRAGCLKKNSNKLGQTHDIHHFSSKITITNRKVGVFLDTFNLPKNTRAYYSCLSNPDRIC